MRGHAFLPNGSKKMGCKTAEGIRWWSQPVRQQHPYVYTRPNATTNIPEKFDVFLTVHHSIDLSKYQLSAHSLNIQQHKLHYTPQHVSSSTLLIIRRTNCITTASGIVTLCTAAYRGWRYQKLWWYNWSSWWWAACCSKHVEERRVTYILLKNKRIVH